MVTLIKQRKEIKVIELPKNSLMQSIFYVILGFSMIIVGSIFTVDMIHKISLFGINEKVLPENFIIDYIKWGGMPQRFVFEDESEIKKYLEDVFKGIVEKDIYKRDSNIEKYKFNTISSYVLSNAGKEFSAEKITNY